MSAAPVISVQRFSLHDGPGLRSTVFLKGCPLHCAWCHNPESQDARPEVAKNPQRCLNCGTCRPDCPRGLANRLAARGVVFDPVEDPVEDPDDCLRCGNCARVCPSGARELIGEPMSAEALMAELIRDEPYYRASGGGVTFSGGEPLAPGNAPVVLDCLAACAARGIHTAVDTSGHVERAVLLEASARADLVLYDLKIMDDAEHRRLVGPGVAKIHANLRALAKTDAEVRVRIPLVPGYTDSPANLEAAAAFVAALPRRLPVDLLPYHRLGGDKYRRLGRTYALADVRTPDEAEMAARADLIRAHGLVVSLGG